MSSVYSGNPAGGARSPAVNPTIPADADLANVASVNAAFQKLADYIAWLQANTPGLGEANTFTQAQLIQALLTLTNNVSLTAAVAQSILKTAAGGLTFGTAATGGDLTLSANGVALLKLLASGSLDAQGKALANLLSVATTGSAATGVSGLGATFGVQGASDGVGTSGISPNGAGTGGQFSSRNVGTGNSVHGAINLVPQSAPSAPADGDLWVETGTNTFKVRINGVTKTVTLT